MNHAGNRGSATAPSFIEVAIQGLIARIAPLYGQLTSHLGERGRFIRRVGAVCLVIFGVHASADWLDDQVFFVVDHIDAGVDALVFSVCDWLGSLSSIPEQTMTNWAFSWGEWIGPEEKENLSLMLGLVTELVVDARLLRFAWGVRPPAVEDANGTQRQRMVAAVRELTAALRLHDMELIAAVGSLFFLSLVGAVVAGQAIERTSIEFWLRQSDTLYLGRLSAALGLMFAVIVLWRLLPDLLLGAARRTLQQPKRDASVAVRIRRGAVVSLGVFPFALAGYLGCPGLLTLLERIWRGW